MRVVFLASTLKLGGAERITGEVSRRLAGRGVDVLWALLKEPGPEGERLRESGLHLIPDLGRLKIDPLAPFRLAKVFRTHRADALYCLDHQNAVVTGALAARQAKVPRTFVAVHTTGLWGNRPSLPAGVRRALPGFTNVIAVADLQARYLVDREGVPAEKIAVIRNGIDLAAFRATEERRARGAELRAEILGGATGPLIGCVAALRPEKGHPVLFEALARLLAANPNIRLALVGDGAERGRLESLARDGKIDHAVTFLGARDDVADLHQAFDLVVLPSHPSVETLPLSLIEAMAAGRPVVATRVGSVEELVADGITGSLVAPLDVPSLAGALLRLCGDRRLRDEFGRKGVERAEAFDIAATVDGTLALMEGR